MVIRVGGYFVLLAVPELQSGVNMWKRKKKEISKAYKRF